MICSLLWNWRTCDQIIKIILKKCTLGLQEKVYLIMPNGMFYSSKLHIDEYFCLVCFRYQMSSVLQVRFAR